MKDRIERQIQTEENRKAFVRRVTDEVLRESGVLAAMEEIRKEFLGHFISALVVNHDLGFARLGWIVRSVSGITQLHYAGEAEGSKHIERRFKECLFSIRENTSFISDDDIWGKYITVLVVPDSKELHISGNFTRGIFSEQEWRSNPDGVHDQLARCYLYPGVGSVFEFR